MRTAGWFGKLPMLGDFAHRRLPLDVVAACDAWLAQGVATSRAALGPAWVDTYLNAPQWGFAWGPTVIDAHWWCGIMMPSVDATGRYFPLLVMKGITIPPPLSERLARWYEALGCCALATLSGQATLASFEASLVEIEDTTDIDDEVTLPQESQATMDALRNIDWHIKGYSTWWRLSPTNKILEPQVWHGLPPADRFTTLLQSST